MRHVFLAIATALGLVLAAPAQSAFAPPEAPELAVDPWLERNVVAETELYCLTLALFFEGGSTNEPEVGQRHIARVVIERAKANRRIWGGPTICGVVFYQAKGVCQFSFACLPSARRTPRKLPAWHFSAALAREALAGRNQEPHDLIRYYMNAELTPLRNVCRFRREFVPVAKAGRHEFFREPTSSERRELARAEFEACTRYAEELKRAELKRKLAAKKAKGKFAKVALKGKKPGKISKAKPARTNLARR